MHESIVLYVVDKMHLDKFKVGSALQSLGFLNTGRVDILTQWQMCWHSILYTPYDDKLHVNAVGADFLSNIPRRFHSHSLCNV